MCAVTSASVREARSEQALTLKREVANASDATFCESAGEATCAVQGASRALIATYV